ncbi:hypothetical protein HYH03_013991 [Edaphochlamys debaryana]|uniref:Thioredoxin domain-containing protein n=1 Tax=Edaphochlamys debaryana TaxID=47281 RepID=A0A835XPP2_9CHLO|nr:hypothetical protein HYH03_013991 [Edaphochlamys debaryana]|eukprot:KAG2487424.1 hypothetical protein HYH03_013991 [Edaphochlamys debaryana]
MRALLGTLAVLLFTAAVAASSYPTEVVHLNDQTFEYHTQASTGQTTGVWAVLFYDSAAKSSERALLAMEALAQDEEKEHIVAKVDVAANIKLARRFGDLIFPPCVLLFRDRQMYMFDQPFAAADIGQTLKEWVEHGFSQTAPLDVPERKERTINMDAFNQPSAVDMKTVIFGIILIVGGLLFQTWAILNKDKFKPEPTKGGGAKAEGSADGGEGEGKKEEAGAKAIAAAAAKEAEKVEGPKGEKGSGSGAGKEGKAKAKAADKAGGKASGDEAKGKGGKVK